METENYPSATLILLTGSVAFPTMEQGDLLHPGPPRMKVEVLSTSREFKLKAGDWDIYPSGVVWFLGAKGEVNYVSGNYHITCDE